jgi:hypothetical protein
MTDTELETPMGWRLFLVDRVLSNEEIASTFGEIFDLEPEDILVITAEEEIDNQLPENISLVCERATVKGDFQLSLCIYPQNDLFDANIEIVESFAKILSCNCLIIDPDPEDLNDEDACLFIQGLEGYIEEVDLDSEYLDRDEYIILKSNEAEDEEFIPTLRANESTPTESTNKQEFHLIDMDRYYFLYEYQGKIIHLPKDIAIGKDDAILTVLIISQATYRDNNEPISASDSDALEHFLMKEANQENVAIVIE